MTGVERRDLLGRAGALADLGRLADAAGLYRELLRAEPEDVQALCGLSRCLGRVGRPAEGLELAGRAAALAPADDWPHRLRSAHLLLLGRPRPALDAAMSALAVSPSGFASLLSLFQAQAALHDAAGAAKTAGQMVAQHPAEAEAHNAVGRAAMLRSDWAAAEAAFREALWLAPLEPAYRSNLALALERRGRGREAMQHFQRAVQTDPGNAAARTQLVHAIDRRLAVAGLGMAGLGVAGAGVYANAPRTVFWAVAACLLAGGAGLALALRWWRLRQLDETVRAFYRHERRCLRGLQRAVLLWVAGAAAAGAAVVGLVGWISRSAPDAVIAAAVLAALLRGPGMRLWRQRVLPLLRLRHGALSAR